MVHAVSATYLQFERMSPPAAGMALALHLAVAAALYVISPLKFTETESQPIEVTMEALPPKPAEQPQAAPAPPPPQASPPAAATTPPPPAAAPSRPTSQAPLGLPPPAAKTVDKPTQEPPKEAPKTQEPAKKEEPQQALAPPKPEPEPPAAPPVEKVLPPVEAPPPPLTMRDFVKIAPPPPPHEVVKPLPRQVTPAPQHQQLPSSPLSHLPQQHPPDSRTANAPSNTFVNPAQNYARSRVHDEYVWAVIRKFSQYLPNLREKNEGGAVVLRFVIARDGRLLDASIARSSGVMALDKGMLEAIRAASPYPPLPPEIPGDRVSFTQEIIAKR